MSYTVVLGDIADRWEEMTGTKYTYKLRLYDSPAGNMYAIEKTLADSGEVIEEVLTLNGEELSKLIELAQRG